MWLSLVRKGEEMWKEDVNIFVCLLRNSWVVGIDTKKNHVQFVCEWTDK